MKFCEKFNIKASDKFSYIMPFDSILNKKVDTPWYIGTSIVEKIECERLYLKPKEKYIKYIHKGECELEADRFVKRYVYQEVPPKVEYYLDELGKKFIPILDELYEWSNKNLKS